MEDIYYSKYIKYKIKYLNLRETQTGGGFFSDLFSSKTQQTPPRELKKSTPFRRRRRWIQLQLKHDTIIEDIDDKKTKIFDEIKKCSEINIPNDVLLKLKGLIDDIVVNIKSKSYTLTNFENELENKGIFVSSELAKGILASSELAELSGLEIDYKRWSDRLLHLQDLLKNLQIIITECDKSKIKDIVTEIEKLWIEQQGTS